MRAIAMAILASGWCIAEAIIMGQPTSKDLIATVNGTTAFLGVAAVVLTILGF
jgi:hypothetical protein